MPRHTYVGELKVLAVVTIGVTGLLDFCPDPVDPKISKGPNRVGVSLPSPEDGNRSSFRDVVFSGYLEFQTMDRVLKLSESEYACVPCVMKIGQAFKT
jgi:hypothetical protein